MNVVWKIMFFISIVALTGCNCQDACSDNGFKYPDSKIWAHQVNDTAIAQIKEKLFDGLEIDLIFSKYQNKLFVGHDEYDTIRNLTFETWLSALEYPANSCFWLDIKNLSVENAETVAKQVSSLASEYGIKEKIFIEHPDYQALKKVKKEGIAVIFWVDNIYWWENKDTALWKKKIREEINQLKPDAVSGEQNIHPLLANTFPKMNIHYWNTPMSNYEKNVERTKELCKFPNVKVVLVDYNEPIDYHK